MTGLELSAADLLAHGAATIARATLLLIGAIGLSMLLRRAPAAARHALWTVTFVGLLALPVLPLVVPTLSVPIPVLSGVDWSVGSPAPSSGSGFGSRTQASANAAGDQAVAERDAEGFATSPRMHGTGRSPGGPAAERSLSRDAGELRAERTERPTMDDAGSAGAFLPHAEELVEAREEAAQAGRTGAPSFASLLALLLWALGALVVAIPMLMGLRRARAVCRKATRVRDRAWLEQLRGARRAVEMHRPVSLRLSPQVRTGMAGGLVSEMIILPEGSREWSHERRGIVLLHELVHLRRRDPLRKLASRLVLALYWFHPLAWYATRSATLACEEACDGAVVALGHRPATYARHLVDLADEARLPMLALSRIVRPDLEKRIMRLVRTTPRESPRAVLAAALVGIIWVMGVAAASPADARSPAQSAVDPVVDGADTIGRAPLARVTPAAPLSSRVGPVSWSPSAVPSWSPIAAPSWSALAPRAGSPVTRPAASPSPFLWRTPSVVPGAATSTAVAPVPPQSVPVPSPMGPGDACRMGPGGVAPGEVDATLRGEGQITTESGSRLIRRSMDGLMLCMRTEGGVSLTDGGRRIGGISEGGWVVLEVEGDGTSQRLEVTPGPDGPEHAWFVDGVERPFDGQARAWRDAMLDVLGGHAAVAEARGMRARLAGEVARARGEEARLRAEIARTRGEMARRRGEASRAELEELQVRAEIERVRRAQEVQEVRLGHEVAQMEAEATRALAERAGARGSSALASRAAALERARQVTEDEETRARLAAEIQELRARAEAVEPDRAQVEAEVERVVEEMEREVRAQREALAVRVTEMEARLDSLRSEERASRIEAELEGQEQAATSRIQEIERQISELEVPARVRAIEEELGELDSEDRIRELQQRIDAAEERLRAIIGEIG